jgi:hypothetical protein
MRAPGRIQFVHRKNKRKQKTQRRPQSLAANGMASLLHGNAEVKSSNDGDGEIQDKRSRTGSCEEFDCFENYASVAGVHVHFVVSSAV